MTSEIVVEHGQFETEEEAMGLARSAGLTPLALDLESSGQDHWHDFEAHVVHREEGEAYRAVVGFARDPAALNDAHRQVARRPPRLRVDR